MYWRQTGGWILDAGEQGVCQPLQGGEMVLSRRQAAPTLKEGTGSLPFSLSHSPAGITGAVKIRSLEHETLSGVTDSNVITVVHDS